MLLAVDSFEEFFLGTHVRRFDHLNRVSMPARFRDHASSFIILSLPKNRQLVGYPDGYKFADPQVEDLSKSFSKVVTPDSDGRVTINDEKLNPQRPDDERNVIFVGYGDFFEIWSKGIWERKEKADSQAVIDFIEEKKDRLRALALAS